MLLLYSSNLFYFNSIIILHYYIYICYKLNNTLLHLFYIGLCLLRKLNRVYIYIYIGFLICRFLLTIFLLVYLFLLILVTIMYHFFTPIQLCCHLLPLCCCQKYYISMLYGQQHSMYILYYTTAF